MHGPIDIFIKGGEIDDKTKLSALFGYKPSKSTKLLVFIPFHSPYHPFGFQITHQASRLRFELCWNQLGFKPIEGGVICTIGVIL